MEDYEELLAAIDALEGFAEMEGAGDIRSRLGDFGHAYEGLNARLAELEAANAELENKYRDVAARNYELMRDIVGEAEEGEAEDEADAEVVTEDEADVTDLFECED